MKLERNGEGFEAKKVYSNKVMTNHHGGVILVGDYLYGFSDGSHCWMPELQDRQIGLDLGQARQGIADLPRTATSSVTARQGDCGAGAGNA